MATWFSVLTMSNHLHDFYARRAAWIAQRDATTIPNADQWTRERPTVHRQFMTSIGLSVMPPECDLRAKDMGQLSGDGYTVTKLAYQFMPDCWGSAYLYRPADASYEKSLPGVLYACGYHVAGGIGFQEHGIAWARRGYVCLIYDTTMQQDNPGDHHAMIRGDAPHWIARGYTPLGVEVLNGMRALDLLIAQPNVDADRVGVTGISGGGTQSFHLAAADDRLRGVAAVAGVSCPAYAVANRHMMSHADTFYTRNLFARDVSVFGALIAPRALMLAFPRHDHLFTPAEYRALHQRIHARYDGLGCGEVCTLLEYDGPHGYNHRDTTDAIHHWFDQHVAGEAHPDVDTLAIADSGALMDEVALSVYRGQTPQPNHVAALPELISQRGQVRLPEEASDWSRIKQERCTQLRSEVFGLIDDVQQPQQLESIGKWQVGESWRQAWHGSLDGMAQMVVQIGAAGGASVVAVGDRLTEALPLAGDVWDVCRHHDCNAVGIEPRAAGRHAFAKQHLHTLNREGCSVGLTPTMMMVQDLHHLLPALADERQSKDCKQYLYGRGEGAIAVLFHALLCAQDDVAGVFLEDLPTSIERTSHQIMHLLHVLDISHAVALLAPMPVALINREGSGHPWYFAQRVCKRVGCAPPVMSRSFADAFDQLAGRS